MYKSVLLIVILFSFQVSLTKGWYEVKWDNNRNEVDEADEADEADEVDEADEADEADEVDEVDEADVITAAIGEKLEGCQNVAYTTNGVAEKKCACEQYVKPSSYTQTNKDCGKGHYCQKKTKRGRGDYEYNDFTCAKLKGCQSVKYKSNGFPGKLCACEEWNVLTRTYTETDKVCGDGHYCRKERKGRGDLRYADFKCVKLQGCQDVKYSSKGIPEELCACERWIAKTRTYTESNRLCRQTHYCAKKNVIGRGDSNHHEFTCHLSEKRG